MSRCFPYPLPGYSSSSSSKINSKEALIESIKLQRESEAKAERHNERKREKKEKDRERKERNKPIPSGTRLGEKRKLHNENVQKGNKSRVDLEKAFIKGRKEDEAEQLERSDVTEEHEHPVDFKNPCYSSDGTQNSNKRRKHGNIIRIRLSSRRHKDPDTSVSQEQPISISARTDLPSQHTDVIGHRCIGDESTSAKMEIESVPSSRLVEEPCRGKDGIFASTSSANETDSIQYLYRNLVENWVPPALTIEHTDDDQEWLFDRKHRDRSRQTNSRAIDEVSSCGNSTLWPRAKLLPEVDIYALPFAVPF